MGKEIKQLNMGSGAFESSSTGPNPAGMNAVYPHYFIDVANDASLLAQQVQHMKWNVTYWRFEEPYWETCNEMVSEHC